MSTTYTKREKFRYLLGLSGQNIIYGTVTSVLAYYLQFTILIPAVWVGLILSVARIFDAVKDPFIGAMISRGKHKLKDYLIAVPIPTAILTILCFSNGIYSAENSMPKNILIVLSAFVFYIIWEVVFTIGDIPITGYPSVLTSDEGDRTKLLSLRPIGGMASGISTLAVQPIAFALSAVFGGSAVNERNAFLITVAAFSIYRNRFGGKGFCRAQRKFGSAQIFYYKSVAQKNQYIGIFGQSESPDRCYPHSAGNLLFCKQKSADVADLYGTFRSGKYCGTGNLGGSSP